ncbi:hypothetical protein DFJ77DRAFT_469210 [Powellomyces hirtus]|nr:hypothetical protein DFJ77DRAFT_469210 [Powellomyces hirtus]
MLARLLLDHICCTSEQSFSCISPYSIPIGAKLSVVDPGRTAPTPTPSGGNDVGRVEEVQFFQPPFAPTQVILLLLAPRIVAAIIFALVITTLLLLLLADRFAAAFAAWRRRAFLAAALHHFYFFFFAETFVVVVSHDGLFFFVFVVIVAGWPLLFLGGFFGGWGCGLLLRNRFPLGRRWSGGGSCRFGARSDIYFIFGSTRVLSLCFAAGGQGLELGLAVAHRCVGVGGGGGGGVVICE